MNMCFKIYDQKAVLADPELTAYILDTIIDNLSYIFGDDMGSEENRNDWISHNLKTEDDFWRVIAGSKDDLPQGFIIYTVHDRVLSICDIEINRSHRFSPALVLGLFGTLFEHEGDNFDTITGYINKANHVSQNNFLKYATSVDEKPRGFSLMINEAGTQSIKNKFKKKR